MAERLLVTWPEEERGDLERLAGEDGLSLASELRSLVKREVARRKRKQTWAVRCSKCQKAK
jgi:hypothetical protein